jgi:hypothetical protein
MDQDMVFARNVLVEFAVYIYFAGAHYASHNAFFANEQVICSQVSGDIAVHHRFTGGRNGTFEGHTCADDQVVCNYDAVCHIRILWAAYGKLEIVNYECLTTKKRCKLL